MLKIFKGLRSLYYAVYSLWVAVVAVIVLQFFKSAGFWADILLFLVLSLLGVIPIAFVFNVLSINKYNKVLNLLLNCKVDEYIDIVEKLDYRSHNCQNVKIDLASAYLDKGNLNRAKELLQDRFVFKENKKHIYQKISYFLVLMSYFFMNRQYDKVREVSEKLKTLLEDKNADLYRSIAYDTIDGYKYKLKMVENSDYEGAEQFFLLMYDKAYYMSSKVSNQLVLGEIYLHHGRTDEAREAFEFVVKNGGRTIYTIEAERHLKELAAEASVQNQTN